METYDRWTLVESLPKNKVKIECECGRTRELTKSAWNDGRGLQHNCPFNHELIGKRFGRLVVETPRKERIRGNIAFDCACDCGATQVAIGSDLKRGNVRSCGCLQREIASARASLRFPTHKGYVSYGYAHTLVKDKKGPASEHMCVCGDQAREWAYDGKDPEQIVGIVTNLGMVYSLNPDHYMPMCAPCHRNRDITRTGE
mgnify:CR=1 FL=1